MYTYIILLIIMYNTYVYIIYNDKNTNHLQIGQTSVHGETVEGTIGTSSCVDIALTHNIFKHNLNKL